MAHKEIAASIKVDRTMIFVFLTDGFNTGTDPTKEFRDLLGMNIVALICTFGNDVSASIFDNVLDKTRKSDYQHLDNPDNFLELLKTLNFRMIACQIRLITNLKQKVYPTLPTLDIVDGKINCPHMRQTDQIRIMFENNTSPSFSLICNYEGVETKIPVTFNKGLANQIRPFHVYKTYSSRLAVLYEEGKELVEDPSRLQKCISDIDTLATNAKREISISEDHEAFVGACKQIMRTLKELSENNNGYSNSNYASSSMNRLSSSRCTVVPLRANDS